MLFQKSLLIAHFCSDFFFLCVSLARFEPHFVTAWNSGDDDKKKNKQTNKLKWFHARIKTAWEFAQRTNQLYIPRMNMKHHNRNDYQRELFSMAIFFFLLSAEVPRRASFPFNIGFLMECQAQQKNVIQANCALSSPTTHTHTHTATAKAKQQNQKKNG